VLYMVIERFNENGAVAVYRRARDRGRLLPAGLDYVSSWVDVDFRRCFQLMETDDPELLESWMEQWQDLVEFEVIPVRPSAEAAALIAPRL
jgi:acetyl esterase/lipase